MNSMKLVPILVLALLECWSIVTAQQQECPDLSPCDCSSSTNNFLTIICTEIAIEEVKSIFNNTPSIEIDTFRLITRPSGDFIPADLLSSSILTNKLEIWGQSPGPMVPPITRIEIDPNAFRFSEKTLQYLDIWYFDTRRLSFDFLTGFQNVSELNLVHSSNLDQSIPTLPELPSLEHLSFVFTSGLKELFESGNVNILKTSKGLASFSAIDSSLDGKTVANLLEWILTSSRLTLRQVNFQQNAIESIPNQLSSFLRLDDINISYNDLDMTIGNNSIFVSGARSGTFIDLSQSRVVLVESGAFQGNYGSCVVNLNSNSLSRFEEGAFKAMLEDMSGDSGGGYLEIGDNPFDCYSDSCHLAWLLRDNRQLLRSFRYGDPTCENGTKFVDLSPNLFIDCP